MTAIYIYGKLSGPYSPAHLTAYRPVYSWHRFTLTNSHFINDLLYDSASRIGRGILSQQRLTERKIAEVSYVISLTEFQAKVLRAAKPDRA